MKHCKVLSESTVADYKIFVKDVGRILQTQDQLIVSGVDCMSNVFFQLKPKITLKLWNESFSNT
ncbi:hypothetical protein HZS_6070 [Henneguya salminicola]|nr:hypothetical protein HZS_6070 [Henneguya salminicola]